MTRLDYLRLEAERASRQFVGGSWAARLDGLRNHLLNDDPAGYKEWPWIKATMSVTSTPEVMARQSDLVGPLHFHNIFEFGAGTLRRPLWFNSDKYFVYDLPEMIALQRWIAGRGNEVFTSDLATFVSLMRDNSSGQTAFFAAWSLSECPTSIRDMVLAQAAECCDLIFLAYQPVFDFIDNHKFFEAFAGNHGEFAWVETDAKPLDGAYLVGRRNRWT